MKKSLKFLMMLMAFCCLIMVSCDKDDHSDEPTGPGNSSTESGYGDIKPTGLKMANLYKENSDGPTELKIPGFPPLRFGVHRNGLEMIYSEYGGLLNCGITDSMENFNWTEQKGGFSDYVHLSSYYLRRSIIYRVKISKAEEYPERFAYARIRFIDLLYSNSGRIIGCTLEYDSPYTPL